MAYPTRQDLVNASDNAALNALTVAQQDAKRAAAIAAVEAFAGQSFEQEGTELAPVTKIASGGGGRILQLPKHLEVLTGIAVAGSSMDLTSLSISEDGSQLHVVPDAVPGTWLTRRLGDDSPPVFPEGLDRVTITGVWGWEVLPPPIFTALLWDMEDSADADSSKMAGTLRSWGRLGLSSISQGPLSATLDRPAAAISDRAANLIEQSDLVWEPVGEVI